MIKLDVIYLDIIQRYGQSICCIKTKDEPCFNINTTCRHDSDEFKQLFKIRYKKLHSIKSLNNFIDNELITYFSRFKIDMSHESFVILKDYICNNKTEKQYKVFMDLYK